MCTFFTILFFTVVEMLLTQLYCNRNNLGFELNIKKKKKQSHYLYKRKNNNIHDVVIIQRTLKTAVVKSYSNCRYLFMICKTT